MRYALRSPKVADLGSEPPLRPEVNAVRFEKADDRCRPPIPQISIFSAMLSASSSSTPRYLTVLSTLV